MVFKSLNKGRRTSTADLASLRGPNGDRHGPRAESPKNPDVLYAGTDDGALWVSTTGGKDWTDIIKNVGLDRPCHVSTIEASRYEEGRAYVAFDGHRSDTDEPLVFVTEDHGKTWKSLRANLPSGSTRMLREDIRNPDLLYLGTEFAIWASLDRGISWVKINNNLPTVAVFEVAIHPTADEIVAATHGRGLWVLDVGPLRQLTRETMKAKATLLKPTPVIRYLSEPRRGGTNRRFVGQNPPRNASIYVALTAKPEKSASVKILDVEGTTVFESRLSPDPGLHKLTWAMTRPAPQTPARPGAGAGRRWPAFPLHSAVAGWSPRPPGTYKVVLTADGQESSATLKIEPDPAYPHIEITTELLEAVETGAAPSEADEDDIEGGIGNAFRGVGLSTTTEPFCAKPVFLAGLVDCWSDGRHKISLRTDRSGHKAGCPALGVPGGGRDGG